MLLVAALALAVMLGLAARAGAAAIALDQPDNGNSPLVAYDPVSQTTFVTWQDPISGFPDLCILPASVADWGACAPVALTDPAYAGSFSGPGGIVVLPNGNVVVLGTPTATATVAWESPGDGSAFLTSGQGLQNAGQPISPVSLFYATGNAVALSDTDVGLLDDYGDYFSDSPFSSESPHPIPSSNSNQTTPSGEFSRKSLEAAGPEIAAEPAPAPAAAGTDIVVGVGDNFSGPSAALPGCLNSAGTGYGVSVGTVNGASNAAGTLNGEGLPAYSVLQCSALAPVVASPDGGTQGIGLLEEEGNAISGAGSTWTIDYHPFVATATGGSFGPGVELADVTQHVLNGVSETDLSEDSTTGVYAAWTDLQGLVVDYSSNSGLSWGPPVIVPEPASGEISDPLIAGIGGGTFVLTYKSNPGTGTQTFAGIYSYQQLELAPTTTTTIQTSGTTKAADITIPAGTVGETDQATVAGAHAALGEGTVSYGLYSSSSCSAASLRFNGGTTAVTNGLAAPSAAVTSALPQGTYYWQAAYTGDAANDPSDSACGSEVLTVVAPSTIGGSASATTSSVTLTISCAVTPCTVTVTVTIDPVVAVAAKKKTKHITITLATGHEKITKKGSHKLKFKLTKAGRAYVAAHHGTVKIGVLISEKIDGHTERITKTIKLKLPKH
jgi:hypothetical protein